ncbi:hypothetical protein K0M31_017503 [Melipona bicolor]|uniref:Uncharacterized protein n=1 Tax=Melipona bicolor TaxID=60889 RepID=A0AA40G535_9HYME|nr:hypothetical protein K0M31_017503 [Melipona bicolor]
MVKRAECVRRSTDSGMIERRSKWQVPKLKLQESSGSETKGNTFFFYHSNIAHSCNQVTVPPHLSRNRRPSIIGLSRSILRMEDEDVRRPLNDRYLNNPRRVTVSNETTRMKNYELFAAFSSRRRPSCRVTVPSIKMASKFRATKFGREKKRETKSNESELNERFEKQRGFEERGHRLAINGNKHELARREPGETESRKTRKCDRKWPPSSREGDGDGRTRRTETLRGSRQKGESNRP